MGIFHFLNVKEGDCSVIQHPSGNVTVIDVCNASKEDNEAERRLMSLLETLNPAENVNQKDYPVNPVRYLKSLGISDVFRFILTHPDMDHMDGIRDFFNEFSPTNFWDTDNQCEKDFAKGGGQYSEHDWEFYKWLRDSDPETNPKRLALYSGARGKHYNQFEDGSAGGDGLQILAPTKSLMDQANQCGDYNDASYMILYRSTGGKILISGDSSEKTWEHLLANHEDDIRDVDLLIAPHHGRKMDSYAFLDVLNPTLTFFGNAKSQHLAYGAWNYRKLPFVTNNQADCMIVDTNSVPMKVYVTSKSFAEKANPGAPYSPELKAYHVYNLFKAGSRAN